MSSNEKKVLCWNAGDTNSPSQLNSQQYFRDEAGPFGPFSFRVECCGTQSCVSLGQVTSAALSSRVPWPHHMQKILCYRNHSQPLALIIFLPPLPSCFPSPHESNDKTLLMKTAHTQLQDLQRSNYKLSQKLPTCC